MRRPDRPGLTKETKPITFVVKRGALRRFDRLKSATQELPAEVVWDRRGQDRPDSGTKPAAAVPQDRRKTTSATWDLADFVVSESTTRRRRPTTPRSGKG
jgi:hypothetical protein